MIAQTITALGPNDLPNVDGECPQQHSFTE